MSLETRKKYFNIAQAKDFIARLEQSSERMPELIGYRSTDVIRYYRRLIVHSYSLAIVFIQYDLLNDALEVLKVAAKADIRLYNQGELLDRLWSGRLVTYTTLGFLFIRSNDPSKALKFLFDAQSLLFSASKSGSVTPPDLSLLANLVTFLALWRIKRYKEASTYMSMCRTANVEAMSAHKSKAYSAERLTLNALVVLCTAAMELKAKGNVALAERLVGDLLCELNDQEIAVVQLTKDFLKKLHLSLSVASSIAASKESVRASNGLVAPTFTLSKVELADNPKVKSSTELLDDEFERLLFVAGFSHFISED
jgi:hypothetical protein